ncbi:MAG: capsid cement protein [Candidatus Competibacteraceae bacterium]
MTTKYVAEGEALVYSNTGALIKSGAVVVIGNLIGVALVDIPATSGTGAVALKGVFTVPKVAGSAWVQGAKLLYDVSAAAFDVGTATPATGDVSGCCVAAAAALSAATTGQVLINMGVGTVT